MPITVVVGLSYGDEGKGKVVNFLAEGAQIVARYQGGANAGHTVLHHGETFKLHLIPSGIFDESKICVIGPGVVLDPFALEEEMKQIRAGGFSLQNFRISHLAHLTLPYHRAIDQLEEKRREGRKIGTTGRGIGPTLADKVNRIGIRICDLRHEETLKGKILSALSHHDELAHFDAMMVGQLAADLLGFFERLEPHVIDSTEFLAAALKRGDVIVAEGAQGSLLDLDHGSYPFVTSSHPISGGATIGLGVPPTAITRVVGLTKAYVTRVGEGPFPTEEDGETEQTLRETGHEYGATTGRPRRVGWLDLPALRYANELNGTTDMAMTKLDILSVFPEIKVCTGYTLDGNSLARYPADTTTLARIRPNYVTRKGWACDITKVRRFADLPPEAQSYVKYVEAETGVPVTYISVGPETDSTFLNEQAGK